MSSERTAFAVQLARRRTIARMSLANLARQAHGHRGYLHNIEQGRRWPSEAVTRALDSALDADGTLLAAWEVVNRVRVTSTDGRPTELLELAARARASDVTSTTLDLLDTSIDTMARAYTRAPPAELLRDVRTSARQVSSLLDGRATLTQRRRLLTAAGWLALLAATLHVDLGQRGAATAARGAADSLGRETEHDEIGAWACEVDTWTALVDQHWSRVASLAAAGETLAPSGSPAAAQLAMQAARAAARLGDGPQVRAALRRCSAAAGRQSRDRPPDHHFYFDGDKLQLYTGTTLAWLGDPAAENYARHAAARSEASGQRRRVATARLDLGLVLARLGRPDEAAHCGVLALESNELVPSNAWRADELIAAVSGYRGVPEVEELRELSAQRSQG
ncbi:MAG TPA: helix-turn-helix transcriptional regulator [Pseudonocardiaceae bacterium]|jgi:transcriptional regulator with XRE-family HTH domain|nr:helix-turn-helix transcriptional regulator [Pseudonocardiaceae bacterium]